MGRLGKQLAILYIASGYIVLAMHALWCMRVSCALRFDVLLLSAGYICMMTLWWMTVTPVLGASTLCCFNVPQRFLG